MANVIARFGKPVLVISPNKTLAAQLYREYKTFSRETRFAILFLITIIISLRLICLSPTPILKRSGYQ